MNAEQKASIDAVVRALSESLFSAWSYFHLLRGLNEGARSNPEVIEQFSWMFEQLWRAIFDGFFARAGTLLDTRRSTYSLPHLVTLIKRHGDTDLKRLLPEVEACLMEKDGAIAKIRKWRHEAVAHRPTVRSRDFHATNRMSLRDIEGALNQLEDALNRVSRHIFAIQNATRGGSAALIDEGKRLFALLGKGLDSQCTDKPGAAGK